MFVIKIHIYDVRFMLGSLYFGYIFFRFNAFKNCRRRLGRLTFCLETRLNDLSAYFRSFCVISIFVFDSVIFSLERKFLAVQQFFLRVCRKFLIMDLC